MTSQPGRWYIGKDDQVQGHGGGEWTWTSAAKPEPAAETGAEWNLEMEAGA